MSGIAAHTLYGVAWLSFAVFHSLLLNDGVRARLRPLTGRRFRLFYTVASVLHLIAVMVVAWLLFGDAPVFDLPPWAWIGFAAVFGLGAAEMWIGFQPFDTARFIGLKPDSDETEILFIRGLYRHVRHPLYGGGVLILWGLAVNEGGVATAVWGALYLIVGALIEERRMLRRFGADYAAYCACTPRFIPRLR